MLVAGDEQVIRFYRASGPYGYLSNLFRRPVLLDGMVFSCAEYAYQWAKFRDPGDRDWAMQAPKPHLLAALAHALTAYDVVENWASLKVGRMREVLRAKFAQHPDLAESLAGTGTAPLVEVSKTDAFWGVGKKGTGKNMLGRLLMEVRAELAAPDQARGEDWHNWYIYKERRAIERGEMRREDAEYEENKEEHQVESK